MPEENSRFTATTHFCIVWGITLAIFSLLEWNSLDRDPVGQQIMSPFIERHIEMTVGEANAAAPDQYSLAGPGKSPDAVLNYEVEFSFNGPIFLLCFFGPMLVFMACGRLWKLIRHS